MFDCPEKETAVPNFKFVSKLTEFSSCQVCKKIWMVSHQYLQSGHSVEHFKGYLNAPMRHPSSYVFSIKTTNFGSPLSELKFQNNWNQILWDAIMNQSVHSVEHFKRYLNAPTRHPSSYAFSIKTTNFDLPLSELKFWNWCNQILWHHITP